MMNNNDCAELFKTIKLLILDVDGVLTKGEIIYDDRGRELKIFNVKDGLGVFLLSRVGIRTILLTARNSPVLKKRAADMHVAQVIGGRLPKESVLEEIKTGYGVDEKHICFVGDDLIDIGLMKKVALGIAVNDAPDEVKQAARYVTSKRGGEGAVREVVDCIIRHQQLSASIRQCIEKPSLADRRIGRR